MKKTKPQTFQVLARFEELFEAISDIFEAEGFEQSLYHAIPHLNGLHVMALRKKDFAFYLFYTKNYIELQIPEGVTFVDGFYMMTNKDKKRYYPSDRHIYSDIVRRVYKKLKRN